MRSSFLWAPLTRRSFPKLRAALMIALFFENVSGALASAHKKTALILRSWKIRALILRSFSFARLYSFLIFCSFLYHFSGKPCNLRLQYCWCKDNFESLSMLCAVFFENLFTALFLRSFEILALITRSCNKKWAALFLRSWFEKWALLTKGLTATGQNI